jgi:hypothetical protein
LRVSPYNSGDEEGCVQPPIRSTQRYAILATLAGALVLAAVVGLRLDAVPPLPAKIILGISLPVLYGALFGMISPAVRPVAPREDAVSVLTALGVSEDDAVVLAEDRSFSVHELKRLLARGCPLGTALRILWPA